MNNKDFKNAVSKRRTFAIISHPDAGKTTLTEKFLLYGGAIREAGSVKSQRSQKHAVSDWMEIEKQRGISVTSSVLQFNYDDYCINILDTPGHEDFSEDTYRTLMAADAAVMVIDCAKGVEAQTKKLFQVCKMRGIPIFTFINKMDRMGKDPFDLVDDIETVLNIKSYAINWPIGEGRDFKGVYDRVKQAVIKFDGGNHGANKTEILNIDLTDDSLSDLITSHLHDKLLEDIELLDIAGDNFDKEELLKGELTPIFFGSALTNFGVEPFLKAFLELTPPPLARNSNKGLIEPTREDFSGFVFKIQANMNPQHRDRIAFVRICSGVFNKGMQVTHTQSAKKVRLNQPTQFMAQDRAIVETAVAGDIIGIHDAGIYNIGDTITEKDNELAYQGIPSFPPEHFAKVYTKNALKRKHFVKGIKQLAEEGAIQVFKKPNIGTEELIIGVVGVLQLEVLEYRLENEYGIKLMVEKLPYRYIRWIEPENFRADAFSVPMDCLLVETATEMPAILFKSEWNLKHITERNADIAFSEVSL